jgi:hypothetical protein
MQTNSEFEKMVATETIKEYINKYGFNEKTIDDLKVKRKAIEYYLKSVIDDRPSLAVIAAQMLKEVESFDAPEWGRDKAVISKVLGYTIGNDATIEEWRGYVKLADEIAKTK